MKKRLEAELISIAHRVLKLKNKSEVDQLYIESQKLHETITLLKFYNDNFEQLKSEISIEEIEDKIENTLNTKIETQPKPTNSIEEKLVSTNEVDEILEESAIQENEILANANEPQTIIEAVEEEQKSEIDFAPIFELAADASYANEEKQTSIEPEIEQPEPENIKLETKQISFEDLLGNNYQEPEFVKPDDVSITSKKIKKEPKSETASEIKTESAIEIEEKPISLNDRLAKSINIGLNDRVGFVKHLFNESTEDYNRVISQLNTFSSFEEAKDFVEEIIKPDYNNWEGKEDFSERFLNFVEQKFI